MIADNTPARAPGVSELRNVRFLSAWKRCDAKAGESVIPQKLAISILRANQRIDGAFSKCALGATVTY
jgi:hypothetical protein